MTRKSPERSNAAPRLEVLREDLVAYLDGELPPEEAAHIERLIHEDPLVRAELQRLAETWDWLDVLERPTVDEDFTRTTIEMVARSAVSEKEQEQTARQKFKIFFAVLMVLGAVASIAVGYAVSFSLWTNPNQWLLTHYAVIENQDFYRHVESVDFLRKLKENGLFVDDEELAVGEMTDSSPSQDGPKEGTGPSNGGVTNAPGTTFPKTSGEPAGSVRQVQSPSSLEDNFPLSVTPFSPQQRDARSPSAERPTQGALPSEADRVPSKAAESLSTEEQAPAIRGTVPASGMPHLVMVSGPDEARRRIEAMSEAEKFELRQKVERFKKLSPAQQERMIKLHEALSTAPDRAELATILVLYYQWFKLLTPAQRGEMEALQPEERIAWIRQTRSEMVAAAINRTLFNFPPARIRQLLEASLSSRPEDRPAPEDGIVLLRFVEEKAAQRGEELLERLSPQERQNLASKLNQLRDPQQKKEFLAITWLQWQLDHPDQSSLLTPQELDELLAKLSPATQARLRSLSRQEQLERVSRWIRGSVFFRYVMPRVWADMRRPVSEQELSRFVEEVLSPAERAELLALSPEEMQRELTRRYLRWRYPGVGMGWHFRGRGLDRDRRPSDQEMPEGKPAPPGQPPGFRGPPAKPTTSGTPATTRSDHC